MLRRNISEKPTLKLFREYTDHVRKLEVLSAQWWRAPLAWRTEGRKRKLRKRHGEISGELAKRYEGVLCQLLFRAQINADDWAAMIVGIWQRVLVNVGPVANYKRFPGRIWIEYEAMTRRKVVVLKRKFMLRPFVDEMDSCDERAAIRLLGFGLTTDKRPRGREILQIITRAYPLLHREVLKHAKDLSELTDEVFSESELRRLREPFTEYENWLFRE